MDFGSGRAKSGWIKLKEVFVSSLNSTGGVLEGVRSSEYEEKFKRAKIEPERAKLMRNPKRAKIEPKKAQIGFCNVGGTRVMVEPTSVDAKGLARTRS